MTLLSMDIKGLGLDTGRVHGRPFQVIPGQLCIGWVALMLANGLDGGWAIDGFFGADDIGQSKSGATVSSGKGMGGMED